MLVRRDNMPKATLTFKLPEEQCEYTNCVNAEKMYRTLWELDNECRNKLKWEHKFKKPDEVLEWVREQIPYELFEE